MFGVPVPSAVLPALVRETPTRTSSRRQAERPSDTAGNLLVEDVDERVRRAARRARDGRRLEVVRIAVAVADSARRGVDLLIELDVELVVVVLTTGQAVEVIRDAGPRRLGEPPSTDRAKDVICDCGTIPSA